jgi:hypothetical protein
MNNQEHLLVKCADKTRILYFVLTYLGCVHCANLTTSLFIIISEFSYYKHLPRIQWQNEPKLECHISHSLANEEEAAIESSGQSWILNDVSSTEVFCSQSLIASNRFKIKGSGFQYTRIERASDPRSGGCNWVTMRRRERERARSNR